MHIQVFLNYIMYIHLHPYIPISLLNLDQLQNSSELTAVKGELVKVTNTALDKKLCIAVTTTGQYGTMKKRNLERIEPGGKVQ